MLGPVFVEFPIDVLYPYQTVAKEIGMKGSGKSLGQRIVNWLVNLIAFLLHVIRACYLYVTCRMSSIVLHLTWLSFVWLLELLNICVYN